MTMERELGWDDEIQKDGGEFIVLPNGDYNFTVTKFERGRFTGSEKMPACNQAKIELTVHSDQGDVVIFHNLFLHSKTEGLLSNFFAGIGQKKKGEKLKMNWNSVVGSKGRAKIEVNRFTGKDGEVRTNNQVKTFYADDEVSGQPQHNQSAQYNQQPQQSYQQQPQQSYQQPQHQPPFPANGQQAGGWTQGNF